MIAREKAELDLGFETTLLRKINIAEDSIKFNLKLVLGETLLINY